MPEDCPGDDARALRERFIKEILSNPNVPDRLKDIAKLSSIVTKFEQIAEILSKENDVNPPVAQRMIKNMILQIPQLKGSDDETFANLLMQFVDDSTRIATVDAAQHVFICHASDDKPFAEKRFMPTVVVKITAVVFRSLLSVFNPDDVCRRQNCTHRLCPVDRQLDCSHAVAFPHSVLKVRSSVLQVRYLSGDSGRAAKVELAIEKGTNQRQRWAGQSSAS